MGDGSIEIWDLESGSYFTAQAFVSPPTIDETYVEVPGWLSPIINSSDEELLKEWKTRFREGASEQRMAIFTELSYRGVTVL